MPDQQWLQTQRDNTTDWARQTLNAPFLILDTETTGLDTTFDEIVQLAVIASTGEVLLDSLIQPQDPSKLFRRNGRGICSADIHGITPSMLDDAPTFPDVYAHLHPIVQNQQIVIYNAQFDRTILRTLCKRHALDNLRCAGIQCAMLHYAAWHGAWDDFHQSFAWQTLAMAAARWRIEVAAPPHSALGDCLTTLKLIESMALSLPYAYADIPADTMPASPSGLEAAILAPCG